MTQIHRVKTSDLNFHYTVLLTLEKWLYTKKKEFHLSLIIIAQKYRDSADTHMKKESAAHENSFYYSGFL